MRLADDSSKMNLPSIKTAFFVCFLLLWSPAFVVYSQAPREPKLIRDTDIAEGVEKTEAATAKEPNPKLAAVNVNIGNQYLKMKNYAAAAKRFLEAIEYKPDFIPAYDGLIRSYEKNGDFSKAIAACKTFLEKNPDSPKASDFRSRIAKLEKDAK
jgi:tetratricopeptide (TPR) repeat protein